MTDIITDIIDEFSARIDAITPDIARNIEQAIRKKWGGEQAYIAKRCTIISSKRQKINDGLKAGLSITQIEQLHGIPRSSIYRIINHKQQRG
jgi:Mor family transcriptional regulator